MGYNTGVRVWGVIGVLLAVGCGSRPHLYEPAFLTVEVANDPVDSTVVSDPPGIQCPPTCSAQFYQGVPVTLHPVLESADWAHVRWEQDCVGGPGDCTFEPSGRYPTVRAVFGHPVLVTRVGSGTGRVTSSPAGIDCPGACEAAFEPTTTLTLLANPDPGSSFDQWEPGCTGTFPSCQIVVNGSTTIDARFLGGAAIDAFSFGGDGTPTPNDLIVDAGGGTVMVGGFRNQVDFGGGAVTANLEDLFVARYTSAGTLDWLHTAGAASTDTAYAVTTTSAGDVLVAGEFEGQTDFGGGPVTAGAQGDALFYVTYGANGAYQSFVQAGQQDAGALDVAVGENDEIYLAGRFLGSIDLGGGAINPGGGYSVFLARYNENGYAWSRAVSGGGDEVLAETALLSDGTLVAGGDFNLDINLSQTINSNGGRDIWLASFNPANGSLGWELTAGGNATEGIRAIAADGMDVIIGGIFQNSLTLGATTLNGVGGTDVFLARIDGQTGAVVSAVDLRSSGSNLLTDLLVDDSGVVAVGSFQGTLTIANTAFLTSAGNEDAFAVRFDSTLSTVEWARSHGGAGSDSASGIAARSDGTLLITGTFEGQADFDGQGLTAGTSADTFLVHIGK